MEKARRLIGNFYKIPFLSPYWNEKERNWIINSFRNDTVIQGTEIEEVEQALKKFLGVQYVKMFNYGRSAIDYSFRLMGISNSEVIVPSLICKGVINPVIFSGNRPAFVDCNGDMNIDADKLKQTLTKDTKAIVMSHLTSKMSDVDAISDFAEDHDLKLIDDSAQVFGNRYEGEWAGTLGDIGILSFGFGKVMMSTQGGAIVTNSKEYGEAIEDMQLQSKEDVLKRVRNFYTSYILRRYTRPFYVIKDALTHPPIDTLMGLDYKIQAITNMDAGLVKIQLKKLKDILRTRKRNALLMNEILDGVPYVSVPSEHGRIFSKYIVTFDTPNHTPNTRCQLLIELKRHLEINRIETEWPYMPIHTREGCEGFTRGDLSNAESLWGRMITLPVHPNMSEEDVIYVGEKIIDFFKRK